MADEEASEKISLHTLDDAEERVPLKELTWREKVARFMSTNKVQYTIIVLVVLDSLIVVFELLIDMDIIVIPEDHHPHHPSGHDEGTANSSSHPLHPNVTTLDLRPHTATTPLHPPPFHNHTLLQSAIASAFQNHSANTTSGVDGGVGGTVMEGGGGGGGGSGSGDHPGSHSQEEGEGSEGEGEHHAPNKHLTEHVLHMASLTILTIFLVEVMFKVYAEGKHLLKHKAEVFDAIVVVVSFTMDITFTIWPVDQVTRDYAGLLVLLRLWRVTRIINGVILSVKMDADKKLKAQKILREKAEKQVQKLTDKLEKLTRENQKLRTRLALLEGRSESTTTDPTVTTSRPDDPEDGNAHSPATTESGPTGSATGKDETAALFSPQQEASLSKRVSSSPGREDASVHSHSGSPVSAPATTSTTSPQQGDHRRSPVVRYGLSSGTPQSARRPEGSCSSVRTPPIESQQLLSFEEPVSEDSQDVRRSLRDPEMGLTASVGGGKLVTSVS